MAWFGLAVFVGGIAADLAPAVFDHGEWVRRLGWLMLVVGAVGLAAIGTIEVTRLTLRLRRRSA